MAEQIEIARMGHAVLRSPAQAIDMAKAPFVPALAKQMIQAMEAAGGTGLAAPQIYQPWRMVIYKVAAGRNPTGGAVDLTTLINPEIIVRDATPFYDWEACLSVPGMIGLVPRPRAITVRAQNLAGETVGFNAEDFHARVILHECDHLDGILYPQRMDDLSLLFFRETLEAGIPADVQAKLDATAALRSNLAKLVG